MHHQGLKEPLEYQCVAQKILYKDKGQTEIKS